MDGNNQTGWTKRRFLDNEKIWYLVFGILTTLVNYGLYVLFRETIGAGQLVLNTALAWFGCICFAFYTNRRWVFKSSRTRAGEVGKEFGSFVLSRAVTGLLDVGIMGVFAGWLGFSDLIVKILSNVIVIVLNYVISKFLIFGNASNK